MPTSSLGGWALTNMGPLSTTYTAPVSCFTEATRDVLLATNYVDSDTNSTSLIPYQNLCSTTPTAATIGDCLPSGKAIDSMYADIDINNPVAGSTILYYSPGLVCPSGHVTVGVASNDAGSIISSGDAFVPTSVPSSGWNLGYVNIRPNVMLQGLDKSETAILCCPSNYNVNLNGYCWSALPSYTLPTVGCARMVPGDDYTRVSTDLSVFGTTVTGILISYVSTHPISKTITQTITDPGNWTAVTMAAMVTLIHNAADATATPSSSSSEGPVNTTSAAGPGRAVGGNGATAALSCWAVGLAVGLLYTTFL
ncbi:hypothetical protein BKA67DRAFT_662079 [Truncatella angustata]|uniref:Uncharacterized protein n=1 Tax=Truncatella angustata TaxID=152316 RepID=A0A9P8ZUP0_9PEZI|nr:uncharacterized protein BKA67DRAFT_662079 [Truncatella angustata]KAH6649162.1 hypothetical protein BKA67DRAFT_662079 [Truncatella angustata]